MTDPSPSERTARTLKRIAIALSCAIEDLIGSDVSVGDPMETRELLTLWDTIGSKEGRQAVLNAARAVIQAQEDEGTASR